LPHPCCQNTSGIRLNHSYRNVRRDFSGIFCHFSDSLLKGQLKGNVDLDSIMIFY